jgi:hypothetical protein
MTAMCISAGQQTLLADSRRGHFDGYSIPIGQRTMKSKHQFANLTCRYQATGGAFARLKWRSTNQKRLSLQCSAALDQVAPLCVIGAEPHPSYETWNCERDGVEHACHFSLYRSKRKGRYKFSKLCLRVLATKISAYIRIPGGNREDNHQCRRSIVIANSVLSHLF